MPSPWPPPCYRHSVAVTAADPAACDEAAWAVLQRLLGFQHTFEPSHCARLLYSVLSPGGLLESRLDERIKEHECRLRELAAEYEVAVQEPEEGVGHRVVLALAVHEHGQ